ncbi:MAG: nitronate monooxygenase [Pseudomonadales bacterium]
MRTALTELLDLSVPIVQAPMAGVSTPGLAAAVIKAGGLGSIAVGAMNAAAADSAISNARRAAAGPLNVNVFVHPAPRRDRAREAAWLRRLEPWFGEFDAEPPAVLEEIYRPLDDDPDLLAVLLDHAPAVVSLHFGLPDAATLRALKGAGCRLLATATSVAEAVQLEAAGIDAVIAQGFEAGGHRGAFGSGPDEGLSTFALLPAIVHAVDVPVLAAGGLSDGAGIAYALELGAAGVQLGTVFVDCPESAAADAYRQALRNPDRRTAMTSVFSGRPARGLVNRFVRELGEHDAEAPDYPLAYDAAKRLAAAAGAAGSSEFAAMWAGEGRTRPNPMPAGALLRALEEEATAGR